MKYYIVSCGNPESSKSISTIFPAAFAHFVSVSYIGNSRNMFNPPPAERLQFDEDSDNV